MTAEVRSHSSRILVTTSYTLLKFQGFIKGRLSNTRMFRCTLASPQKQVLVPRATKRPAPGTTPPTQNARAAVDRTSGWRLESRANRNHTILPRRLPTHARRTRGSIDILKSARIRSTPRAEPPVRTLGRGVDGASGGAWQAPPSMPASTGTSQLAVRDAER